MGSQGPSWVRTRPATLVTPCQEPRPRVPAPAAPLPYVLSVGGPLHSHLLPRCAPELMGRKNHTHRTVTLISKNRNSIGKWEMWMRSPELMNRYDGVNFLRCLTHTTTYCVSVLNSLSSRCQRSEVVTWAGCGWGGQFGTPPCLCPLSHVLPLCPGPNTPLFPREVTGQAPQPSSTTSP